MRIEFKKVIINYIFEYINSFNLTNQVTEHFSDYIYDKNGNYLIGGEAVYNFIVDTIELLGRKM